MNLATADVFQSEIARLQAEIERLRDQAKTYAQLLREVADDLDGKPLGGLEVVVRRTAKLPESDNSDNFD